MNFRLYIPKSNRDLEPGKANNAEATSGRPRIQGVLPNQPGPGSLTDGNNSQSTGNSADEHRRSDRPGGLPRNHQMAGAYQLGTVPGRESPRRPRGDFRPHRRQTYCRASATWRKVSQRRQHMQKKKTWLFSTGRKICLVGTPFTIPFVKCTCELPPQ